MNQYCYSYPRPMVTVDAVVFQRNDVHHPSVIDSVLLIQRGNPPFRDQWALPGGFLEMDETLEAGARRELAEETGIHLTSLTQVGAFGTPGRDPRGRNICIAFTGIAPREQRPPKGGDDANDARFFPLDALPPLAFDHGEIIDKALKILNI